MLSSSILFFYYWNQYLHLLHLLNFLNYYVTTISHCCINATEGNTSLQWKYNQCYSQFCSTGQAFQSFFFQRANISEKCNFPSFLNLGLKEQHFNKFRKFVRSTCLHFHFDSLSQTFHRTGKHLSESVLQMCNSGSYRLKNIIGCFLSFLWKFWLIES